MPIYLHQRIDPEGEIGLWKIEEPEIWFLEQLNLTKVEEEQIAAIKGRRRLEWLAGRLLLHQMSGRELRGECLKDEHGKPYLIKSKFEISISHSNGIAAIIAAPKPCGIDIQKLVSKIERITHKFMRREEMESLRFNTRLKHLHVYWGAKEALYKAYGRRQLDFKEHIWIEPFRYDIEKGTCKGIVRKKDFYAEYEIQYAEIEDFILVYGVAV